VRVLIVDDSPIVQDRLSTLLLDLPEVELIGQAQEVNQAIQAIRELKPDAVILDIRIPGGSGIDVLEAIKKDAPAPIVIVLTNYPYPQYRERCAQAGAEFFLDKSTEFDRIPAIFRELIQGCSVA
jgi:DNA-binding NarL/FixJ family response regulator